MKTNLTKQEAKEMSLIRIKKKISLAMILEHYSMDIKWRDNEEEESEMIDTFIRATDYVRELEEMEKLLDQGKLRKSNFLN